MDSSSAHSAFFVSPTPSANRSCQPTRGASVRCLGRGQRRDLLRRDSSLPATTPSQKTASSRRPRVLRGVSARAEEEASLLAERRTLRRAFSRWARDDASREKDKDEGAGAAVSPRKEGNRPSFAETAEQFAGVSETFLSGETPFSLGGDSQAALLASVGVSGVALLAALVFPSAASIHSIPLLAAVFLPALASFFAASIAAGAVPKREELRLAAGPSLQELRSALQAEASRRKCLASISRKCFGTAKTTDSLTEFTQWTSSP